VQRAKAAEKVPEPFVIDLERFDVFLLNAPSALQDGWEKRAFLPRHMMLQVSGECFEVDHGLGRIRQNGFAQALLERSQGFMVLSQSLIEGIRFLSAPWAHKVASHERSHGSFDYSP
jgi:hypothetical protein